MMINTMTSTQDFILTHRERDMLILVCRGLSNADIARDLGVSTRTVKSTLHRICVKTGARSRTQAAIIAMKHRAIGIHEVYSLDELADVFIASGPEVIGMVLRNLKSRYGKGSLPAEIEEYLSQLKKSQPSQIPKTVNKIPTTLR
jgi:DNA-binding CsgD family transcriptional regulator